jgi:hypothetical protein
MAPTYQFADHLREHRPSRLGQRLWRIPLAGAVGVVIADGVYMGAKHSTHLSVAVAAGLPLIGALLLLVAWAALSIADWTYPAERRYWEALQAADQQARDYILAGRHTRTPRPPSGQDDSPACVGVSMSPAEWDEALVVSGYHR